MCPRLKRTYWLVGLMLFACVPQARSQEKCSVPIPSIAAPPKDADIFTAQQEVDLGDIQAGQIEHNLHVIPEDKLTEHMNEVLRRLVAQLPPTGLNFRVILIDLPVVNSMSIAGGRIYVTRKMVAFLHNDDELAGLLAHEMGHALSHQAAIRQTRLLQQILAVTSVGDRQDNFDKFNRLIDNIGRDPKLLERLATQEEPQQYQADQIAIAIVANAGYNPESFTAFFDRLAQTNGKTGNWLTDFFAETTINEKRLREIRKSVQELPPTCRSAPSALPSADFLAWQAGVIGYSGLGRPEKLVGLMDKRTLTPPLRADLTNVKFSPDGKFLLAQDDASIFVLSHDPLRLLFRIDARNSYPAQFTPDSKSVVFSTHALRMERWSVPEGNQTEVHELALPGGCVQSKLSSDGSTLACMNRNFDLLLLKVADGGQIVAKKQFFLPDISGPYGVLALGYIIAMEEGHLEWAQMDFSPDSRYFLVAGGRSSFALNLLTHQNIALHGGLDDRLRRGSFAFDSPDRVISVDASDPKDSGIFGFPSGRKTEAIYLRGEVRAPTRGNYVLAGPLKDYQVGALNLSEPEKFTLAVRDSPALDIFDDQAAVQAASGQVVLVGLPNLKKDAAADLPLSPLGTLLASDVSPDLQWLAMSGDSRGGVWNVSTASRLYYTRGFRGAYFDSDVALYSDFPKLDPKARSIAKMNLNGGGIQTAFPIDDGPQEIVRQWGRYLVTRKPAGKKGSASHDTALDVANAGDGHLLWTRIFPKEMPAATLNADAGTLLVGWPANSDAAKEELKNYPTLRSQLDALKDKSSAYFLEEMDAATGHQLGQMALDTGKWSFDIDDAYGAGSFVVVSDNRNRTLVYSLSTGQQIASYFGSHSVMSVPVNLLSIENEPGVLDIYKLGNEQKTNELTFSSPVALQKFSADGARLFVLTENQTEYVFDSATLAATPATTAANNHFNQ